jgi:hypothetical protein
MRTAHDFLTDQGSYIHTHVDADLGAGGYDEYDLYQGDTHNLIFQHGKWVDTVPFRFFEGLLGGGI